jgi:hypothetical protein
LTERGGIAKGGALPEIHGADGKAQTLQSLYCLFMPLPSRRHGIQQGKGGLGSCQLHQLQRCRDRFKVVDLRPSGDDNQIGAFRGGKGSLLGPGRSVDDGEVYPSLLRFAEGVLKPCGLRIYDDGTLRLPSVAPVAGGRLWVQVNNDGGLSVLLGRDGKG